LFINNVYLSDKRRVQVLLITVLGYCDERCNSTLFIQRLQTLF